MFVYKKCFGLSLLLSFLCFVANCSAPPECVNNQDCGSAKSCQQNICKAGFALQGKVFNPVNQKVTKEGHVIINWGVYYKSGDWSYIFGKGNYTNNSFSLNITKPMPDGALNFPQTNGFGIGYLTVLAKELSIKEGRVTEKDADLFKESSILGASVDYVIVYKSKKTLSNNPMGGRLKAFDKGFSCAKVDKSNRGKGGSSYDTLQPVDCSKVVIVRFAPNKKYDMPNLW